MIISNLYPPSPSKTLQNGSMEEYEYAVLTDFATGLSSYVTSRTSPSIPSNSVHDQWAIDDTCSLEEDAELLVSFMSSAPVLGSLQVNGKSAEKVISPSLSFETNYLCWGEPETQCQDVQSEPLQEHDTNLTQIKVHVRSNENRGKTVQVTYPCLSLTTVDSSANAVQGSLSNMPLPVSLLSRPVQVTDKSYDEVIKYVADQLALNAMTSFKLAMEWRAKVWISTLVRCARFKSSNIDCNQDPSSIMASKYLETESSDLKVIRALLRTLSSVTISDVRTTVQVLEKQMLTSEKTKSYEYSGDACGDCKLLHAVNMDFTFTISNHNDVSMFDRMSVHLHTPGFIHGSFSRSLEHDLALSSVELILDTSALSHGIERQSRHIVRSFTEEYIWSCHPALYPCIPPANIANCVSQIKETTGPAIEKRDIANVEECYDDNSVKSSLDGQSDESLVPTSYEPHTFPIVTPHEVPEHLENTDSSHSVPSTLSVHSVLDQSNPNKRQRLSPAKYLHPRRVSPNFLKSDSSSESLKDDSIAITGNTESYQTQNVPSIISPNPVHQFISVDSKSMMKHGPSLPLLAELMCGTGPRKC